MEAYSMDLRQRVIAACDGGLRIAEAARRFSLHRATIHRWLQRRRHTGSIGSLNQHTGRKRKLDSDEHDRLAQWVKQDGNMTIAQLRTRLGEKVSASTISRALRRVGVTFKQRRSAPPNKTVKMSSSNARHGNSGPRRSTLDALFSLTRAQPRRT